MALITGLDSSRYISVAVLGKPRKWVFSDGITPVAWLNGIAGYELGISAPPAAPSDETTRPAGSLTVTAKYGYVIVYKRSLDGTIGNPSPTVYIILAGAENGIGLNIPADANLQSGIDTAVIYRTEGNGSALFLDGETAYDGTLTTYDSTKADSDLGLAVETDNNIPPRRPYIIAMWGQLTFFGSITYETGTVAVQNGLDTLTFAGAAVNKAMIGNSFRVVGDSKFYTVATIDATAQTGTIDTNYEGTTASGKAYTLELDPLVLAWSKIGSDGTAKIESYPATNIDESISGADNEKAVGIGKTRNAIIPLTDYAAYYVNWIDANTRTNAELLMKGGGISQQLITNLTGKDGFGDMVYMDKGYNIMRINGTPGNSADLSGAFIQTILSGEHEGIHRNLRHNTANASKAHMIYYPNKKWLMVFICLGTTTTYPNACLVADMSINPYGRAEIPSPWMLWTGFTAVSSGLIPDDSDGTLRPWFGDDLGFRWKMDDTTNYNDGVPSGTVSGTITAITATKLTDSAAAYYTTGDGLKGVRVRTYDSNGNIKNDQVIQTSDATSVDVTSWDSQPVVGDKYNIGAVLLERYLKNTTEGIPDRVKIPKYLSISYDNAGVTRNLTVREYIDDSSTPEVAAGQIVNIGSGVQDRLTLSGRGFRNQIKFEKFDTNEPITIKDWTEKKMLGGNK